MVPFSALATSHWTSGLPELERYNGVAAYEISGQPAPGVSSSDAMAVSILFVFLCLAALYESWSVPLSDILAVPAAAQRAYDLSLARYRMGTDSYLDTLVAQRALYAAARPKCRNACPHSVIW